MDNIIEKIYKSCDENNSNLVHVASLIEFIKPYMSNNLTELEELRAQLDPSSTNPQIGYEFFQRVLSHWIEKMQGGEINPSLSECSSNITDSFNPSLSQNESNFNNNNTSDVNLEVQTRDLKYQLNKATAESVLAKKQLTTSKEQNEGLIAELESIIHKVHNREQQSIGQGGDNNSESSEKEEEVDVANERREQLENIVTSHQKQQRQQLAQINLLKNENQILKMKLKSFEKMKEEDRRSLTELQKNLDLKESELLGLIKADASLRSQLHEQIELIEFYKKEHNLFKKKTRQLEDLIRQSNSSSSNRGSLPDHIFNPPKLLNQLSNRVTPKLEYATSSPNNSAQKSANSSTYGISNISAITTMRSSPHITLKEELADIKEKDTDEAKEIKRLQGLVKEQDDIKKSLWKIMKGLENDKTHLLTTINEEQNIIEDLKVELKNCEEKNKNMTNVVTKLHKVEANLEDQLLINAELEKKLAAMSHKLDDDVLDIYENSIETLNNQLKIVKVSLNNEKLKNFELRQKLNIEKSDASTETVRECLWGINAVSDPTNPKKTNFEKQKMRIERMLEKQEKMEKELAHEKDINAKLSTKCQELSTENDKIKKELNAYNDKVLEPTKIIDNLRFENRNLVESLDILEEETDTLRAENSQLKNEKTKLTEDNYNLNENLRMALNKSALEVTVAANLRAEINYLMENNQELTKALREKSDEVVHLLSMRVTSDGVITRLREELSEKVNEIRNLRKQIEFLNIDGFLAASNKELRSAILDSLDLLNCDRQRYQTVLDEEESSTKTEIVIDFEKEMAILRNNIKLMTLLFQTLGDRQNLSTVGGVTELSDRSDEVVGESHDIAMGSSETMEDTFSSCTSQIGQSEYDIFETLLPLQYDAFFDNLGLEALDLKQLSQTQLEQKFTSLALILTFDITTSKKRWLHEREKFNQLASNFNANLNCSLDTLKKKEKGQKTVISYLEKLRVISGDLLKCAVECGVLHYEKRMVNCWNLAINYVAILTQENKKLKQ